MQISFHIGSHCTDDDVLMKSLIANAGVLRDNGVIAPGPGRYRELVLETRGKLKGAAADRDTQDMLLDAIVDADDADRVVMSDERFLCWPGAVLSGGEFHPNAARNTSWLRSIFPDNDVEFFIAIRDPATLLPELYARTGATDLDTFMAGVDPLSILWSDVINDIRGANPDCPITVWCNEDTPMIWPEVMHEVAGLDPSVRLKGGFNILRMIMSNEGMKRLRAYLAGHPPANEIQRRRVISAFLDKFALEEEIEAELDIPGWTGELVEELTATYEDDMLEIRRIPGVTLLTA